MEVIYTVATLDDLVAIKAFADGAFRPAHLSEDERTLALWHVRWRGEALEHYLKIGWSFVARVKPGPETASAVCGFFLAQPFIHFRGQTQTLWVEEIQASQPQILEELADIAVRLGREKHLQRILFAPDPNSDRVPTALQKWPQTEMRDAIVEIRTTK